MMPKLSKIVYRHQLSDMDIRNNFRMYSHSLQKFELHKRHFTWFKAFQGINLPQLTHFSLTDSNQTFITDDIMLFSKAFPNITNLNLSGVSNLENHQLTLILTKLEHIRYLSLLRNTRLTDDIFTQLVNKTKVLEGVEMGGKPDDYQHNISLDGIEILCSLNFTTAIKSLKFEYCSKIGSETIIKLAESCPELRELTVIRNFSEKSARIDDSCIEALA